MCWAGDSALRLGGSSFAGAIPSSAWPNNAERWAIDLLAEGLISWPLALLLIVVSVGSVILPLWTIFRFLAAAYKTRLPAVAPEPPAPAQPDPFLVSAR